jgi:DNA replication ATP-dependent helicase Dna2
LLTARRCPPLLLPIQSQGRDKDAMLLSLVRSNAGCQAGRLLADWQRVNVAITRARAKLLLVGSARTLASVPLLATLLAAAERGGWLLRLPADALGGGAGPTPMALDA